MSDVHSEFNACMFRADCRTQADTITALRAEVKRLEMTKAGLWEVARKDFATISDLRSQLSARDAEVRALRGFAQDVNEFRLDIVDVQEIMEKHGLIEMTYRLEPCGEDCYCRDEYGINDFPLDCYKATPLLTGEPGPGGSNDQA